MQTLAPYTRVIKEEEVAAEAKAEEQTAAAAVAATEAKKKAPVRLRKADLAQGEVVGRAGDHARHVRGVLAHRQKAARVQRAGDEGQARAEMQIGSRAAHRRGQFGEIVHGHGPEHRAC